VPDKDGQLLPPLPNDVYDGEKYSVKVKEIKCQHEPILIDSVTLKCSKCGNGWFGPNVSRLYEAMRRGN